MKSMRRIRRSRMPRPALRALPPARVARSIAVATLFIVAASAGCRHEPPRPDVLLVTIDTLRSDHCSAYGYAVPTTPTLERLASGGVLYRRAYAESSTTAPSHAVLMTGRHFRTFGLTRNGGTLPDDVETLAESMHAVGYETAGFISSFPLIGRFGFSQGFDIYEDRFVPEEASAGRRHPGQQAHDREAGATLARVVAWLETRNDTKPLFLWVHFVDPHFPYRPPASFEGDWPTGHDTAIERYDGEVRYADQQLGRLIDRLAARETRRGQLIVVTSDHGEGLGDHDWMTHGINLYEEAVRVPLIAKWKGHLPAKNVVDDPVGLIDVAPGILSLLEIDPKTEVHGRHLFDPPEAGRSIFLQRRDYRSSHERGRLIAGEMTAVVAGSSKLIVAPGEQRRELYDLAADAREQTDLLKNLPPPAAASPARDAIENLFRRLDAELFGWQSRFPAAPKSNERLDLETRKALRSLGYVD